MSLNFSEVPYGPANSTPAESRIHLAAITTTRMIIIIIIISIVIIIISSSSISVISIILSILSIISIITMTANITYRNDSNNPIVIRQY